MTAQQDLIGQLEEAVARHDIGRRAETLRRVTDLFVSTAAKHSVEQVALFDEVMSRLLAEIETSARAAFGHRLATIPMRRPMSFARWRSTMRSRSRSRFFCIRSGLTT